MESAGSKEKRPDAGGLLKDLCCDKHERLELIIEGRHACGLFSSTSRRQGAFLFVGSAGRIRAAVAAGRHLLLTLTCFFPNRKYACGETEHNTIGRCVCAVKLKVLADARQLNVRGYSYSYSLRTIYGNARRLAADRIHKA